MEKSKQKMPLMDIYLASYLVLNRINPELVLEGTRVVFEFPATKEVYRISRGFNNNPSVPVLDYVREVRQLRARMIAMKGGINK